LFFVSGGPSIAARDLPNQLIDEVNCNSEAEDSRDVLPTIRNRDHSRRTVSKYRPKIRRLAFTCIAQAGTKGDHASH
jgi:hypothetical protein